MKKLSVIKLKNNADYNEAWLQKQIWEDPSILGLGDLHCIAKEKVLPYGRLDILLGDSDSDNPTRYEVEVQLGDPDHFQLLHGTRKGQGDADRWNASDRTFLHITLNAAFSVVHPKRPEGG